VLVGLLAATALPAAVVVTRWSDAYELLHAAAAVPVALVLGVAALVLARRARRRVELTLGRARGARSARVARWLGLLALWLAATGAGSLLVYEILKRAAD
jgi:hypothetical protein